VNAKCSEGRGGNIGYVRLLALAEMLIKKGGSGGK